MAGDAMRRQVFTVVLVVSLGAACAPEVIELPASPAPDRDSGASDRTFEASETSVIVLPESGSDVSSRCTGGGERRCDGSVCMCCTGLATEFACPVLVPRVVIDALSRVVSVQGLDGGGAVLSQVADAQACDESATSWFFDEVNMSVGAETMAVTVIAMCPSTCARFTGGSITIEYCGAEN